MLKMIASELVRFVPCNGVVTMEKVTPIEIDRVARDEGNAAHWLCEQVHKQIHGTDELVDRKAFNGYIITGEMVDYVTPYLSDIKGKGAVEVVTSYGDGQYYQIEGRADHIHYDPDTFSLYISDFKYGWSLIEVQDNWTLLSHAFGWLFANPDVRVDTVILRIYQPRPYHPEGTIRTAVYTIAAIWTKWAILQAILTNPNNMLNTGPHCHKCDARGKCKAFIKAGMNAIEVSESAANINLAPAELAYLLEQSARAIKILKGAYDALEELALHEIRKGKIIPGYAISTDLTNISWNSGVTVESIQMMTGMDLSKKTLLTPGQAVKEGLSADMMKLLASRKEKGISLDKINANKVVQKMLKGKV